MARRPRVLSRRIEAIEYTHAADGLPYRHDFERADSEIELNDDGSVTVRNARGKRLWGLYGGKPFLENPPGGTMATKKKRARRAGAHKRTTTRARKARRAAPKRRRRVAAAVHSQGGNMAARKRSTSSTRRRRNPSARRRSHARRHHRRNPPVSARGFVNVALDGAINGATVLAGKAAARAVVKQLGYAPGGSAGVAVQAGVGLLVGAMGGKYLGAERARFLCAGAFSGAIEALAKNIATDAKTGAVSKWYGDYLGEAPSGDVIGAYPSAGLLPDPTMGDMGAYDGLGAYDAPTMVM